MELVPLFDKARAELLDNHEFVQWEKELFKAICLTDDDLFKFICVARKNGLVSEVSKAKAVFELRKLIHHFVCTSRQGENTRQKREEKHLKRNIEILEEALTLRQDYAKLVKEGRKYRFKVPQMKIFGMHELEKDISALRERVVCLYGGGTSNKKVEFQLQLMAFYYACFQVDPKCTPPKYKARNSKHDAQGLFSFFLFSKIILTEIHNRQLIIKRLLRAVKIDVRPTGKKSELRYKNAKQNCDKLFKKGRMTVQKRKLYDSVLRQNEIIYQYVNAEKIWIDPVSDTLKQRIKDAKKLTVYDVLTEQDSEEREGYERKYKNEKFYKMAQNASVFPVYVFMAGNIINEIRKKRKTCN
ncbi:MAG: hypothetical protein COA69_07140 [Robiginitomaculum sp.]|nr:MAG: hypothetical protein COA69_07140 [Robiginitomaculum sp.]